MTYPAPEDMSQAPVWENYVVAQTVQASLGLLPSDLIDLGVEIDGLTVQLHVQVVEVTPENEECLEDLVDELHGLLGPRADVKVHWTVGTSRHIDRRAGLRWIFLQRCERQPPATGP